MNSTRYNPSPPFENGIILIPEALKKWKKKKITKQKWIMFEKKTGKMEFTDNEMILSFTL